MKIVLIGGNGFIGKNLYRYLKNKSYSVVIYDRFIEQEDDTHIKGKLEELNKLSSIIRQGDVVVHLAGNVVPALSGNNIEKEIRDSVIASIDVFELCAKKQVEKIIFASSGGAVYGLVDSMSITEKELPCPISTYGINKLTIEHFLRYIGRREGIKTISLRIANPYGYGQKPFTGQGVIATYLASVFLEKDIEIWGDGSNIKDYIYIDDVAKAVEKVIQSSQVEGTFNIGTGKGTSINQLLAIIEECMTEQELKTKFLKELKVDVKRNILNCEKAFREFGWRAETDLSQGIKQMIQMWEPVEKTFTNGYR